MSDQDPMGVTITSREIYDQIVGLREEVRSLTQHNETTHKTLADHEERLRGIERWKYSIPAALASSVGAAAVAVAKSAGLL